MIALFCVIITFQITFVFCATRLSLQGAAESAYDGEKLAYVDQLYREIFVEDIDREALTDELIRGYLAGAGERFGSYLTAEEYAEYVDSLHGDLVGIGIHVMYDATLNTLEVISVMDDSPAQSAGIKPGDRIVAVDGVSLEDNGYYSTVNAVRGEEGSQLTVSVYTPDTDEMKDLVMTREKVTVKSVFSHMYEGSRIGVVRITEFNSATVEQFEEALASLEEQGAQAYVFDLRDNPGGELNSIIAVLDILLPQGDIIISIDKDGNEEVQGRSEAGELEAPMAVLINGNTASAAELFAGNIRDYGKGPLIGETTYGKGTMQTTVELPDGSGVSITYRKFVSAGRQSHNEVGIQPDIEATLPTELRNENLFKIADADDSVLGEAIKYLTSELTNN